VVEGPIRVGKSTLAKVLAEQLHARRIFDCEDNPFLGDFYDEKDGAAFRAQMYFLYERHRRLMQTQPEDAAAPIVSDFLFERDKIFAYLNLEKRRSRRDANLTRIFGSRGECLRTLFFPLLSFESARGGYFGD